MSNDSIKLTDIHILHLTEALQVKIRIIRDSDITPKKQLIASKALEILSTLETQLYQIKTIK